MRVLLDASVSLSLQRFVEDASSQAHVVVAELLTSLTDGKHAALMKKQAPTEVRNSRFVFLWCLRLFLLIRCRRLNLVEVKKRKRTLA